MLQLRNPEPTTTSQIPPPGIEMPINEVEVHITADGLGRAAIVRRNDGLFCIYKWYKLAEGILPERFAPSKSTSWFTDETPLDDLYKHRDPLVGIYGTADDARRELLTLPGFAGASLTRPG
jgi:hypothetical protein